LIEGLINTLCSFGCIFVQHRRVEFLKLKELHTVEQCEEENQVDMGKFRPNCRKFLQHVEKTMEKGFNAFNSAFESYNHSNMPISNPSCGPSLKSVVILAILNSKYSIQSKCFQGSEATSGMFFFGSTRWAMVGPYQL